MDTEFGKKLRDLIGKSGLSLSDFAAKLGVNRSQISLWINGSRIPRPKTLRLICEKLNVPLNYFDNFNATQNITTVSNSSVSQFQIENAQDLKKDIEIIKLKLDKVDLINFKLDKILEELQKDKKG